MNTNFEALAKAFVDAGAALGVALVEHLTVRDPDMAAKVAAAVANGERMQLSVEFDPIAPGVRLCTLDDYGNSKRVMHVPAAGQGVRH